MNIIKKITKDSDEYFSMPSFDEYCFILFSEGKCQLEIKKDYLETFSASLKEKMQGFAVKKLSRSFGDPADWNYYLFENPCDSEEKQLIKDIKNNWGNLRSASRREWLKNKGKHTKKQINALSKFQNYSCAYCGSKYTEDTGVHKDHVVPIVNGGTNDISNIVLACPRCNISKNDNDPNSFMKRLEKEAVINSYKSAKSRFDDIRRYAAKLQNH